METTVDTDSQNQTTEVEVSSVFDGLILGVIPFIEEDGRISLLINPIKSDVDRTSLEPEQVGAQSDQSISLPEVRIKEISTTIALNTDDVVILGGLIDRRLTDQNKGVPGLASIPVLGYLFKSKLQSEETREVADNLVERLSRLKGADSLLVMNARAYLHILREEYQPAADLLQRVLDVDEDKLEAGINMAVVEIRTENRKAARNRLKKLKQVYPDVSDITEIIHKLR